MPRLLTTACIALVCSCDALVVGTADAVHHRRCTAPAMEFGKGFGSYYSGWNDWVKEYPEEDRAAYPALFSLPDDCYEITINKPLGIAFIENDDGGVCVDYLVEGGNAAASGQIKPGDVLLATTACMGRDGTFERKVIPSRFHAPRRPHRFPRPACCARPFLRCTGQIRECRVQVNGMVLL